MTLTEQLRKSYAPGVPYTAPEIASNITDILEGSAQRYPERAALDYFSKKTTYRELVEQARKGATVLQRAGIKPGDRVALLLPNCPQHLAAVFSILYLGAIVVEHNPLAPKAELEKEFQSHNAKVAIVWEKTAEKIHSFALSHTTFSVDITRGLPRTSRLLLTLPIAAARDKRNSMRSHVPASFISWDNALHSASPLQKVYASAPTDPALLIHTGGTTGIPKAAVLTQRSITSNVAQIFSWIPDLHEGSEVVYCVLPLFHCFGFTLSFLTGIAKGATLALFPKFDATMFLTSQRRLPCTILVGVPPIFERLLNKAKTLRVDLSSIRFAISGAMSLNKDLAQRWEKNTHGFIIEGYGMTEASPVILASPLSSLRRPGALGLPFPSTEIRIVDPENPEKDTPEGEVGELLVKGPQVFQGYWDLPEETDAIFFDGWLRTGDLIRITDGYIYMADRRKEMINSSGFNVYPSQVEDVLSEMPGVREVAVVGIPAGTAGESVVAALVLEGGASVTLDDVREWAERSLAHYALPRQIVVMAELPRSQIGKIMRRKVRESISPLFGNTSTNSQDHK